MVNQGLFLHDLPTRQVDENGIVLHASKLGGADQPISGTGERGTDQHDVGVDFIPLSELPHEVPGGRT